MGIRDLVSTIRKSSPESFKTIPLGVHSSEYEGKTIVIDGTLYIMRYSRALGSTNWVTPFLKLMAQLTEMGLRILVVLDTKEGRPEEKSLVADKQRLKSLQSAEIKAEVLKKTLAILDTQAPEDLLSESDRDTLQKAWTYAIRSRKFGGLLVENHYIDQDTRHSVMYKRYPAPPFPGLVQLKTLGHVFGALYQSVSNQLCVVPKETVAEFSEILRQIGIPVIKARDGEGEALCVALQLNKVCHYVLTEDSDVLAYGAESFWRLQPDDNLEEVRLEPSLRGLGMSQETFVDFCILCGTDFNERIKGIGPAKARKLLEKHKTLDSIDAFLKDKGHTLDIDYVTVRRIFREGSSEIALSNVMQDLDYTPAESIREVDQMILEFMGKYDMHFNHAELAWAFGILAPNRHINIRGSQSYTQGVDL